MLNAGRLRVTLSATASPVDGHSAPTVGHRPTDSNGTWRMEGRTQSQWKGNTTADSSPKAPAQSAADECQPPSGDIVTVTGEPSPTAGQPPPSIGRPPATTSVSFEQKTRKHKRTRLLVQERGLVLPSASPCAGPAQALNIPNGSLNRDACANRCSRSCERRETPPPSIPRVAPAPEAQGPGPPSPILLVIGNQVCLLQNATGHSHERDAGGHATLVLCDIRWRTGGGGGGGGG